MSWKPCKKALKVAFKLPMRNSTESLFELHCPRIFPGRLCTNLLYIIYYGAVNNVYHHIINFSANNNRYNTRFLSLKKTKSEVKQIGSKIIIFC